MNESEPRTAAIAKGGEGNRVKKGSLSVWGFPACTPEEIRDRAAMEVEVGKRLKPSDEKFLPRDVSGRKYRYTRMRKENKTAGGRE